MTTNSSVPPVSDPNLNVPPVSDHAPLEDTELDRYRKDMLKFKEEAAILKKQIDDMKLNTHKEKEDWKTVAELHETTSKEFKQKYSALQQSLINEKKVSALTIEAQKHGINPASLPDLELLDFDEIQVETTTNGKILVSGQDRAIAKLKTMRPHWFNEGVPSVNPSSPHTKTPIPVGAVTLDDVKAAELQYKKTKSDSDKNHLQEIITKYKTQ